MNPQDVTVLIPAAGRVPEGLIALSNISCPAMIPVGGRPVIHWTLSYLLGLGLRKFRIAVARAETFIEDFVDCAFGEQADIQFLVPKPGGVGQTILELAAGVTTSGALIVLGDTHFQFPAGMVLAERTRPFVLTHPVEESYRWCIAETANNGTIRRLHDKQPDLPPPLEALIGVYYFSDAEQLKRAARDTTEAARETGKRAEIAGILERVQATTPIDAVRAGSWLDCGNPDMQARSHQALLQARAFNELSIDPVLGTLTKRSRNNEKFIDEINYLRLLPPDLAVLFPRLLAYSTDWSMPWVEMEYYGYPSLSEVFLFENVDPGVWERIFAHLHSIITDKFARHRRPLSRDALATMYVDKTRKRCENMRCTPELAALVQHPGEIIVNGVAMKNLPQLWPQIEAEVARFDCSGGTVIHGDLCLSNILYDLRSRICKLIDPRGSFGGAGVFGDPRYDVAKLWHSIHGLYDFIVNDLFHVKIDRMNAQLSIRATAAQREIEDRFRRVFLRDSTTQREIELVTALLFASMPALHYDKPARQAAMYIRAIQLLNEHYC